MPQCPPLEYGHQSPNVPNTSLSQEVSLPLPILSPPLTGRALGPLTPPIGRGRSPLHCHPSPWPGGRDSHHAALLSCPGSSLAQRWSASSHDGSAGTGNGVRPSGAQLETQEPLLAPTPLPCLPNLPYLQTFCKGNEATGTRNLRRRILFAIPDICK